jgi:predicted Zn-dependent peptidase
MQKLTLKNGMRVHLVPFSGTEAATVLVLTKVGSRYEHDDVWGGSHYIEHLMFKGTKRRPNTVDISRTLDRYGAQFNAYTGKDLTGYYVKIAADKVEVAVDLLHDMIFHSLYDQEEMEREKQVIIEEIKMYEENPIMHLDDLLERGLFAGNRLGKDIAGTPESMRAMKREDVIAFRDAYYIPSRMVVVIAGNVPENALELLEQTFGTVAAREEAKAFESFGDYPTLAEPRIQRQFKPELNQIQLGIGFAAPHMHHKDEPVAKLLSMIFGGAMSSRLFIEVRERRGLCYSIRSSADTYEDIGMFTVTAGLDAARLEEAMKTIFAEMTKIKTSGVTAEELEDAKTHMEGGLKLALENSSTRAEFVGRQELFKNDVKSVEDRIAQLRAVTAEDVQRLAQVILQKEKMTVSAIGPYENDDALRAFIPEVL